MKKYNPANEKIKHRYRWFLKEAKRYSEASIDTVDYALAQFDTYNGYKDFKRFRYEQAVGFKKYLAKQKNQKTSKPLSKSTLNRTLKNLKAFFEWLSMQSGYKATVSYSDAEYFNLSEKEVRIASSKRQKRYPTLAQVDKVLATMPTETAIDRRNRALIAFGMLTGARNGALASFKLRHVDLESECVHQDGRDVNTKFSKTFDTYFVQVGDHIKTIFKDWVTFLRVELIWGEDDPLFPSTEMSVVEGSGFSPTGLKREHWKHTGAIRRIYRKAFEDAGLPYFHPHSFRDTLVSLGSKWCRSPEEMRAFSQNLGHELVFTSLTSYGDVTSERQAEIMKGLSPGGIDKISSVEQLAKALESKGLI